MAGHSVKAGSGYAFALASASDWEPVRLATTANVAVIAGGAPSTVDGVAVVVGDRILVRAQAALPTNGIYVVEVVGGGATGTWTRAGDANTSADFVDGKTVAVGEGVTLADSMWMFTSNAPFTLGVSDVVFRLVSSGVVTVTYTSKVSVDSPYPVASNISAVFYNTVGGNSITQLPSAVTWPGRKVEVKKTSTLNTLNVTSVAGNVETSAPGVGVVIAAGTLTSLSFISDGTDWWID